MAATLVGAETGIPARGLVAAPALSEFLPRLTLSFPFAAGPREQGAQCWVCFLAHSVSIAASPRLRSHASGPNCTYSSTHVLSAVLHAGPAPLPPPHAAARCAYFSEPAAMHSTRSAISAAQCSCCQQAAAAMHLTSTQQLASPAAAASTVLLWLPAWSCMPPAADRLGFVPVIQAPGWPRARSTVQPLTSPAAAVAVFAACSQPAPRSSHVAAGTSGQKDHKGRWKGMDAGMDASDDQVRGRGALRGALGVPCGVGGASCAWGRGCQLQQQQTGMNREQSGWG